MNNELAYYCLILLLLITHISCEKDVSVSPPDIPAPNGKLIVNSYPSNFRIFLNGKDRIRRTPDSLTWLDTGEFLLTLKKDLFLDTTINVEVIDGERSEVFIDFSSNKKMLGNLTVDSNPKNALIFLNDSNTTKTTPHTFNNIIPGTYKIRLELAEHESITYYADVSSQMTEYAKASLADTTIWEYFTTSNSDFPPPPARLTCITIDPMDYVWVGTRYGVVKYDGNNWQYFIPDNAELPHQVVNEITTIHNGEKWIATNDGIAVADYNYIYQKRMAGFKIQFYSIISDYNGDDSFIATTVVRGLRYMYLTGNKPESYLILPDSLNIVRSVNNILYIGSQTKGVFVTDINDVEKRVKNYTKENSGLISNNILALYPSNEGVWFACLVNETRSDLVLLNNNNFEKYVFLKTKQRINTIYVDSKNRKWIGTDIGLFVFNDFADNVLLNMETTGLPIENVKGVHEDSKGNIWFVCWERGVYRIKDVDKFINKVNKY